MRANPLPSLRGRQLRSFGIVALFGIAFALPARAQLADLDLDLANLLAQLTSISPSAPTSDRLDNLDDIAARLLAPDGLLSDISAEIGNQGHLLDLRAADVASLRVDLSSLRSALDLTTRDRADLTDLRATVGTHTVTLADHERRIDQNTTDIATLTERSVTQGKNIQQLGGAVAGHETRITALETRVGEDRDAEDARLDALSRQLNASMDRMGQRIDTAYAGVAMAMALKSPYVPEDKSFALSGGWGNFEGKNAFGMSGAVRAGQNLQFDAGVAIGADQGNVGGRAGATFTW